jgi:hypothetical protein
MKTLLALLMFSLALASCKSPAGTVAVMPAQTAELTSTPALTPYWDYSPLNSQPDGGWSTYINDELNFTFQYPAVYDTGPCGKLWIEDKFWRDPPSIAIGLKYINIYVYEEWTGDLANQVSMVTSRPEVQLLTPVEPFSIGGLAALRFIFRSLNQPDMDYQKLAFVAFEGRLYEFKYTQVAHVTDCDAPPLSAEAVYDYLLSTVEFNQ